MVTEKRIKFRGKYFAAEVRLFVSGGENRYQIRISDDDDNDISRSFIYMESISSIDNALNEFIELKEKISNTIKTERIGK